MAKNRFVGGDAEAKAMKINGKKVGNTKPVKKPVKKGKKEK